MSKQTASLLATTHLKDQFAVIETASNVVYITVQQLAS